MRRDRRGGAFEHARGIHNPRRGANLMQEIEFHRALARPGLIIDAGAHEGGMTVALAALPDVHVLASGSWPAAVRRRRAVAAAAPALVTARPEALSDCAGIVTLS